MGFWNKDNRRIKGIFDKENTADTKEGLFYDNQNCDVCFDDCCILLEGVSEPILLEGSADNCIQLEGCDNELSLQFLQAYFQSL